LAIIRAQSSHTLSYWNLFLSCVGHADVVFNAYILTYADRLHCCIQQWGAWDCTTSIMGGVQFACTLLWHVPVFFLYVIYIREQSERDAFRARLLLGVFCVYTLGLVALALYFVSVDVHSSAAKWCGEAAGVCTLVLTVFIWTPQLVHTYRAKTAGALSIPMLAMQAPGSAMFAYFQAVSNHTGPTTYLPACSTAAQQFLLLFLCLYYCRAESGAGMGKRLLGSDPTQEQIISASLGHASDLSDPETPSLLPSRSAARVSRAAVTSAKHQQKQQQQQQRHHQDQQHTQHQHPSPYVPVGSSREYDRDTMVRVATHGDDDDDHGDSSVSHTSHSDDDEGSRFRPY